MGPDEIAITHDGQARAITRPREVLDTVRRVRAWKDAPETCQNCHAAHARSLVGGVALCPQCRMHRDALGVEALDARVPEARAASVTGDGLTGHAIVFNVLSLDVGGFQERIQPHAVNRSLTDGTDLRALVNHDAGSVIGRTSANTLRVEKDARGLRVAIVPPTWAGDLVESVHRGDITGQSFGFRAIEDEWNFDGPMPIRDVLDMAVREVSVVAFPAYPQTTIGVERNLSIAVRGRLGYLERRHRQQAAR